MRRIGTYLAAGIAIGNLIGLLRPTTVSMMAQSPLSTAISEANIPPVANPPLYPDAPQKPYHWSIDDLHRNFEAHAAFALAHPNDPRGDPGPQYRVPGLAFRTHDFGGLSYRVTYRQPRESRFAGVVSQHDDADQHQSLTDFSVFIGGSGKVAVDGEIVNRAYGRKIGPDGKTVMMPGEFNGQPIRGGQLFDVKAGDWTSVPPNSPHQYQGAPGEGLGYVNLKIHLGFDHPGIAY